MKAGFQSMKHRGPDNTQFVVRYKTIGDREVMIVHGFHRLCINGLNPKADQPFSLENTVYCTNGEIWNCDQLHEEMGIPNKTGSDCECIAPYYRYCGSFGKLVETIDGDFGIGMYDELDDKVYVGRDRMGIRSLYYAIDEENNFYVASELKGIPTHFTNVRAFPPAHWASFDVMTGFFEMHNYWNLETRSVTHPKPECELSELSKDKSYLAFCREIETSLR